MRATYLLVMGLFVVFVAAGCTGDTGPVGATGATGEDFPGAAPPEYVSADGLAGGAAYSKWWTAEAGGSDIQPMTTAPAA